MRGNILNDMRRWQWWIALLTNWVLIPFAWLTWRGGAPVWGAYLLIQVGTVILNDKVTKGRWPLAILCINLLAATVAAHKLSTQLYYDNVNTYLTKAIGELGMIGGIVIVIVMSAFVVAAKGRRQEL